MVHRTDGYPINWPADPAAWLTPAGMLQGWVAVTGQAMVVGHVLLHAPRAVHVASVSRLFVSPNARRRGLGGRLLEHAKEWASTRRLNLILEVADGERSPAIALYERSGWQRIDTVQADWRAPDGGVVTLHRYAPEDPEE